MKYRFILRPYKGVSSRQTCPACKQKRCFSQYIDVENKIIFPEYVGRCDHEQKCAYHFTPKDYFERNPDIKYDSENTYNYKIEVLEKPISYISPDIVKQTLSHYHENKLFQFLSLKFGEKQTQELMNKYKVGTANYWPGSTVFWQTDINGKVRTGKIMLYNQENGKRIKIPHNHITWVHSIIKQTDYNLKQCFFGEHLIDNDISKPIAIVESEKSALIASIYLPEYLWLATGGKNGCFRKENLQVLKNHQIVLFPDLGATNDWISKMELIKSLNIDVKVFDYMELNATDKQISQGYDIADFLLELQQPEGILNNMIKKNPALEYLMKEFNLKLIT